MTRKEAIHLLVRHDIQELSRDTREQLLIDWWSIDASDLEYDALPDALKAMLAKADEPDDPMRTLYDPLLDVALRRSFVGVTNSYLERRLAQLGTPARVEGVAEELAPCPCCRFRTLQARGGYEICRVCFWEDDGSNDIDRVSAPNHMSLREAREAFARLGAITEGAREHVLPDGKERYARHEG